MLMMEQMSILFDCVRRSGPSQAELLAELLPQVLLDFFPPVHCQHSAPHPGGDPERPPRQ